MVRAELARAEKRRVGGENGDRQHFAIAGKAPVPVAMAMTLEAVFVKPDHGLQLAGVGTAKPLPI